MVTTIEGRRPGRIERHPEVGTIEITERIDIWSDDVIPLTADMIGCASCVADYDDGDDRFWDLTTEYRRKLR
jgi:hypothetical protein